MHEPTPVNVTLPPPSEHAPAVLAESIEKTTGLPEPPPVAVGVYLPPSTAWSGRGEVKVIVCGAGSTHEIVAPPSPPSELPYVTPCAETPRTELPAAPPPPVPAQLAPVHCPPAPPPTSPPPPPPPVPRSLPSVL